jgi:uncharacterized membrane protein YsdA (DUF1294 family)
MIYFEVINFIGFCIMGADKRKAQKHQWRIPEKTLWLVTILGGAIGSTIGMYIFRHKTKRLSFTAGFPILAILHILILFYLQNN